MKKEIVIILSLKGISVFFLKSALAIIMISMILLPVDFNKAGQDMSTKSSRVIDTAHLTITNDIHTIDSNFIPDFKSENNEQQSAFVVSGKGKQSVYALGDDWRNLNSPSGGMLILTDSQINFPLQTTSGYTVDSSHMEIDSLFIRGYVTEGPEIYRIDIAGRNGNTIADVEVNKKYSRYEHVVFALPMRISLLKLGGSPVFNRSGNVVGIFNGQPDGDLWKAVITLL